MQEQINGDRKVSARAEKGESGETLEIEGNHHPAEVWTDVSLGLHYAVHLSLPAEQLQRPRKEPYRITYKGVTEEEWLEKNQELKELLEKEVPLAQEDASESNLDHFYNILEWRKKQIFPAKRGKEEREKRGKWRSS